MKFEFSMAVKAVPTADVRLSLDCSAEELSILLSDPVYQELGRKIIQEVSFKPQQRPTERRQQDRNNDRSRSSNRPQANHQRHADRNRQANRNRQQEAYCRQSAAVQKVISTINDRMDSLRNGKSGSGWGELD